MAIYQSGVIFDQVDTANPYCWTLDEYVKRGGYSALRRILSENISQTDVIDEVKNLRLARSWRCRLPDRFEMELYAPFLPGRKICGL